MQEKKSANRLAHATSPYLKQHQYNPVDWHEWGIETLEKAKKENKPIFLSIGYSACHWCHVMEKESFENEAIADCLNRHFICVKVDREERPDIDDIYMLALQAMSGHGGWPMSFFLPGFKAFFAGAYFPPDNTRESIGFKSLIEQLANAWKTEPERLLIAAEQASTYMIEGFKDKKDLQGPLSFQLLERFVSECEESLDVNWGGFGHPPKFPPTGPLLALMRAYRHRPALSILDMIVKTLDKMSQGGIYDQLGGGFHRYSVDEKWLVPHFEKMLSDNALLARVYLDGYQLTKKPAYLKVAEETLNYLLNDMQNPNGGFYSSEDADSEGVEGSHYVWSKQEILTLLGEEAGQLFCRFYGVTEEGNFEGSNILYQAIPFEKAAKKEQDSLTQSKALLKQARDKRPRRARDDKILTDWNSLTISSLARAYQATQRPCYLESSVKACAFIRDSLRKDDKLWHSWLGQLGSTPGFLEDYASYIQALIDLYESSFDKAWLQDAIDLTEDMIEKFWDRAFHSFFSPSEDHNDLPIRTKSFHDNATPAGNASAALALIRLSRFLDRADYKEKARLILEARAKLIERAGRWHAYTLCAIDAFLTPSTEIILMGSKKSEKSEALLKTIHDTYLPNKMIAGQELAQLDLPLLKGKDLKQETDDAFIYLCHDFQCLPPIRDASELKQALTHLKKPPFDLLFQFKSNNQGEIK